MYSANKLIGRLKTTMTHGNPCYHANLQPSNEIMGEDRR
jgi:hypothetical protein